MGRQFLGIAAKVQTKDTRLNDVLGLDLLGFICKTIPVAKNDTSNPESSFSPAGFASRSHTSLQLLGIRC